jgi:hypothetical protein
VSVPSVVVAVTAGIEPRMRAILAGWTLRFVQTGSELMRALDEARCTLLIVEVHFDDSAAVAALRCVRSREEAVPVVCVRDVPSGKPLRMAGAEDFIDLAEHRDDEAGNARVRRRLLQLLAG